MPEISRFYGIIIAMFHDEHNPPHFHARYGSEKISIRINDLSILSGAFPPRALGIVMEWASLHQSELMQNWELATHYKPLEPINPLKQGAESMWHDIMNFRKLGGYRLELEFDDGKRGVVDLQNYTGRGGVFSNFADKEYFDAVTLNKELGVLCWPGGVDIAPETIYEAALVAEAQESYGK